MIKESPICIDEVLLCAFTFEEKEQYGDNCHLLTFDKRNDFLADTAFAGIAIKVDFCNRRPFTGVSKGVRRNVSVSLIDVSARQELDVRQVRINMPKDNPYRSEYVEFAQSQAGFTSGHTYKFVICDETASVTIYEQIFHVYGEKELGHPAGWYEVEDGGIRPDWKNSIYKSVKVTDNKDLYVRFDISHKFGKRRPVILPELEVRLYYPDGERIENRFIEPECMDFGSNRYFVEMPFYASDLYHGVYYAELLCMEYPVAGFVFSTSGPEVMGMWYDEGTDPFDEYSADAARERFERLLPTSHTDAENTDADEFEAALDRFISDETSCSERNDETDEPTEHNDEPTEINDDGRAETKMISLDHLTGLGSVKEKLSVYERVVLFNRMRADKGFKISSAPLHAMFLGSPGTGKTTVARIMGVMLHRAGVLSRGHVVVRERATLLGQNYNSESEKTLAAIDEAQGGILFIDEAYQLYQPNDSRDPGKFVIETLLTALSDESRRDWMLILAGYPEEMRRMSEMNPGLRSRIPDSNIYIFDDFTEVELMEIAERYLSRQQYTLSPEAHLALADRLAADYSRREKNFGNARHVINLIQTEILPAMAVRVTTEGDTDDRALTEIKACDIITRPMSSVIMPRRHVGFAV